MEARSQRLTSLYAEHASAIYGFLMARCADPTLAGDVMSEVFVAAARATAGDRPEQVTRPWLLTTARRRLIDHWRRESTRTKTLTLLRNERPDDTTVEHGPDRERVMRALASLPTTQRVALTLRYLDDYSVSEVADEAGISYRAAESLLARARRSFQRAWGEQ